MVKIRTRPVIHRLVILGLASLGLVSLPPAARAAEHPTLVDVATTDCSVCHDDLWEPGWNLHPPVEDDCTTCHEFSKGDAGLEVVLMATGTELCVICHSELEAAAAAELPVSHAPVADDCTTCHNPHASAREKLLAEPLGELCGLCHDVAGLQEPHGGQLTASTDCRSCHDPHGSKNRRMLLAQEQHPPFAEGSCKVCHRPPFGDRVRLRSRGEKLCTSCHGDLALPKADDGTIHKALLGRGGRAGCLECHDPHMSSHRRLLHGDGPEVCAACHEAVVAAASSPGGHAAAEDCLNCHQPHRSDEKPLLNEPKKELCALCHDTGDAELAGAHLGADLGRLDCTSCHDPHGSEHGKLLARTLHGALETGCETCHDGASDRFNDEPQELCLLCHDDVQQTADGAAFPHAALVAGDCVTCHNPHASAQDHLVKSPGAGPCAECHDAESAGPGEVEHAVITRFGCRACHEPHGGSKAKLLREEGSELCLTCHDARRLEIPRGDPDAVVTLFGRFETTALEASAMATLQLTSDGHNHPITGHRALGTPTEDELRRTETTWSGSELTCLSCHSPHKGRSAQLFLGEAANTFEACAACHPK